MTFDKNTPFFKNKYLENQNLQLRSENEIISRTFLA